MDTLKNHIARYDKVSVPLAFSARDRDNISPLQETILSPLKVAYHLERLERF